VITSMTNPLVGHVILSQDHMLLSHVIQEVLECHMIEHMTGQVIVFQGHVVEG